MNRKWNSGNSHFFQKISLKFCSVNHGIPYVKMLLPTNNIDIFNMQKLSLKIYHPYNFKDILRPIVRS